MSCFPSDPVIVVCWSRRALLLLLLWRGSNGHFRPPETVCSSRITHTQTAEGNAALHPSPHVQRSLRRSVVVHRRFDGGRWTTPIARRQRVRHTTKPAGWLAGWLAGPSMVNADLTAAHTTSSLVVGPLYVRCSDCADRRSYSYPSRSEESSSSSSSGVAAPYSQSHMHSHTAAHSGASASSPPPPPHDAAQGAQGHASPHSPHQQMSGSSGAAEAHRSPSPFAAALAASAGSASGAAHPSAGPLPAAAAGIRSFVESTLHTLRQRMVRRPAIGSIAVVRFV